MTLERRSELKEQCCNERTLRDTLAALELDLAPKQVDVDALLQRKCELVAALAVIDGIKAELAAPAAPPAETTEESAADESAVDAAKKNRKHE